ncbi:MAG TPA: hypothetical protein VFL86_10120 [Burkholderiaceae bacterium]|nr:hypothetical protein [Burkholderiaceae bacterium]
MIGVPLLNLVLAAHPAGAMWPVALYACGWSLMVPVVAIMVADLRPQGRGWRAWSMASRLA